MVTPLLATMTNKASYLSIYLKIHTFGKYGLSLRWIHKKNIQIEETFHL